MNDNAGQTFIASWCWKMQEQLQELSGSTSITPTAYSFNATAGQSGYISMDRNR